MQPSIQATGRRKTARASARLSPGKGIMWVNKKLIKQYFRVPSLIHSVQQPLRVIDALTKYDVHLSIRGGGTTGQAEAARHAIARAIVRSNPEHRPLIKANKLLTRDSRMVERKKYGQPKARKKFTYVKR